MIEESNFGEECLLNIIKFVECEENYENGYKKSNLENKVEEDKVN